MEESRLDPFVEIWCPHCGETSVLAIPNPESEGGEFDYDCEVCCRPFTVTWERNPDGSFWGDAQTDQD